MSNKKRVAVKDRRGEFRRLLDAAHTLACENAYPHECCEPECCVCAAISDALIFVGKYRKVYRQVGRSIIDGEGVDYDG